jgi:hypothetical protein
MSAYGMHGETSSFSAGSNLVVSRDQRGNEHGSYYLTRSDSGQTPRAQRRDAVGPAHTLSELQIKTTTETKGRT